MKFSSIIYFITSICIVTSCSTNKSTVAKKEVKEKIAPKLPLEDFFKNPEKSSFSISPNGKYFAFKAPFEDRMNVFVQKIGDTSVQQITKVTDRDITWFFWANDDRILYMKDDGGNEDWKIFGVNKDGSNFKALTNFDKVRTSIIDNLENIPDTILVGLNKRDPRVEDAYKLNINTGELKLVGANPGNYTGWMTDHEGKLRIAYSSNGVSTTLLYRDTENDEFEKVITTNFKESIYPTFFTFDNKNVYALSNLNRDKTQIIEYDIKNNKEIKVLFKHDSVDIAGLYYSKKRQVLTACSYNTWKTHFHFFDNISAKRRETLRSKFPGYDVGIASANKNENKFIIRVYNEKTYGSYYFYDEETGKTEKLTDISPWLNEKDMAQTKPISYQSRDGLTIHGYLTLPKGVKAKNLPVIIHPHGGPSARDNWGFNPTVQFLANRGYAVLQMNFRGSTGYGKEFWTAGFKKWGKEMQNDITDGVNWLINEKIADKEKVAIFGASYGGYATLAGLCFTPDVYACGVDYVGVSNIFTILENIPPYWEPYREMLYEMIGNPVTDSTYLQEVSPKFHADKIKAPLFIAQGANDPRVKKIESDQMVEAMKERGVKVQYMVKENEGHGFRNQENKMDFYREMEKFLNTHLVSK